MKIIQNTRAIRLLEINPSKEKTLFSRVVAALNDIEGPLQSENIVVANLNPSTTLNDIAEQLGKYAKHLKKINPTRPRKLPVMAG